MASAPLICIISTSLPACIDEGRLAAAGDSVRVRRGATSPGCDLLFSRNGVTLAFLLFGGADEADLEHACARVDQLAKGFRRGYVLLPYDSQAAAARLVARYGAEASLSFVTLPLLANPTAQALALAQTVLGAGMAEGPWREAQDSVVASAEAVTLVLTGLPLPPGCDRTHVANMLRTLGSIQHISQKTGAELAAHTELSLPAAQRVAAFFRQGTAAAAGGADKLQPYRGMLMRSL